MHAVSQIAKTLWNYRLYCFRSTTETVKQTGATNEQGEELSKSMSCLKHKVRQAEGHVSNMSEDKRQGAMSKVRGGSGREDERENI